MNVKVPREPGTRVTLRRDPRPVESRANRRYRSDRCETSIDEIVESPRFFCSRLSISEFQRARSSQRVYGTSISNNGDVSKVPDLVCRITRTDKWFGLDRLVIVGIVD